VKASPVSSPPAVEANGLVKRFGAAGEILAVDGLSLRVTRGEVFGLVGPDGAGKTTTLRLLAGVMPPSAGSARILGLDVTRDPEAIRARLGYAPQNSSLYVDLSVAENLQFYAELFGVRRRERDRRMADLLAFSRLEPFRRRLARNLSGGMRQKLALCCALIHQPEVLFLDEPTIGVDPVSRRDFWLLIYRLLQQGLTLLVSTPYLDEAERCRRVALMDHGRLIVCETPAALRRLLPGRLVELRGPDLGRLTPLARELPGVVEAQSFGDTLHLRLAESAADPAALQAALTARGFTHLSLRPIVPSLEDVFVSLLRDRRRAGAAV
jgi:ABC-2 type transport system ATP-binding protein